MSELIKDFDWSKTCIGPVEAWPVSLRNYVSLLLHSRFPMLLLWGEELRCFYNDAFRASLGTGGKHPAMLGQPGPEALPETWHLTGPQIERLLAVGEATWFENQLVPIYRNGKLEDVYWTFSQSPVCDDCGRVSGILVTCTETTPYVTQCKKLEESEARYRWLSERLEEQVRERTGDLERVHQQLLSANAYLQRMINVFTTPLQVLEPIVEGDQVVDFVFKLTNKAYAVYAGKEPEDLSGKKVSDFFPGYFETDSFRNICEVAASGVSKTWENAYVADGLNIYNLMSAVKMDNDIVVHFTDFTDLKHLQLKLETSVRELQRSNAQLEEFAHAASHDLKEPVRKITVFTGRLQQQLADKLTAGDRALFERVESASLRMGNLIDDLLLYSQVSQQAPEKESIDLNKKMQHVLEELELDIQEKAAVVTIGTLPIVQGYRRQLQQLFQNLVSNAIKYSKAGVPPQINITATVGEEEGKLYHIIHVKDNGIGFAQAYAEKIFQMFQRLHGKGEYSGTGVGLSIVKKVVENHGGFIRVKSAPNEGATFRVYLPF